MSLREVVRSVQTVQEAQEVVAALTERFASPTAVETLKEEGRFQKRSWQTVAYHTAGNFLRLGRVRRY